MISITWHTTENYQGHTIKRHMKLTCPTFSTSAVKNILITKLSADNDDMAYRLKLHAFGIQTV